MKEFRIQTNFLFLPKTIGGKTKWLTTESWREERHQYKRFNWFNILEKEIVWSDWKPVNWI